METSSFMWSNKQRQRQTDTDRERERERQTDRLTEDMTELLVVFLNFAKRLTENPIVTFGTLCSWLANARLTVTFFWNVTSPVRPALFRNFTQHSMLFPYRRFGTTYLANLRGLRNPKKICMERKFQDGTHRMSLRLYHFSLHKFPKSADLVYIEAEARNHTQYSVC